MKRGWQDTQLEISFDTIHTRTYILSDNELHVNSRYLRTRARPNGVVVLWSCYTGLCASFSVRASVSLCVESGSVLVLNRVFSTDFTVQRHHMQKALRCYNAREARNRGSFSGVERQRCMKQQLACLFSLTFSGTAKVVLFATFSTVQVFLAGPRLHIPLSAGPRTT